MITCVGFYNYKYYCLTILYSFLATIFCNGTYFIYFLEMWVYKERLYDQIIASANIILGNIILVCLGYLLILHSWLIINNYTLYEYIQIKNKFPKKYVKSIYDINVFKNLEAVFGRNKLFWLLPIFPNRHGKGTAFKTIAAK